MQPLRTRTPGSDCFRLTAFLSEAKLSQTHRYSVRYLSFEILNTIPIQNNTQSSVVLLTHSHLTYSQWQRQSTPQHPGLSPFSTALHPSHHCTTDSQRLLCVASQYSCKEQQSSFDERANSPKHIFGLPGTQLGLPFFECCSHLNFPFKSLASTHEQVWFSALALIWLQHI